MPDLLWDVVMHISVMAHKTDPLVSNKKLMFELHTWETHPL